MDEFLLMTRLMSEFDDEDFEDFELPEGCHLRSDKIGVFDLKKDGKFHPLTDDILKWQAEMESAGKYDEIPDDPKEVIRMFEEGILP